MPEGSSKFVFFDLGNVLVTFDHETAVRQLADVTGCSRDDVRQCVFASQLQLQYEQGQLSSGEFAATVKRELHTCVPATRLLSAYSAIFEPNDAILPVLELLRQAGIRMGVLSNTSQAHWLWIAAQRWQVPGDWFECRILSYRVQSMKPDERIYCRSEQQSGCRGKQIFFTDDRLENIQAADSRGWETCHFQSAATLTERLQLWLAS